MAISIFDLFSIGIGPSSSHTVGPMRAAWTFVDGLSESGELARTRRVKAELFGSLGATGHGHGSAPAVVLGLAGERPESVDTDSVSPRMAEIRESRRLSLLGRQEIGFREDTDLVMHRRRSLPAHPNGMVFRAFDTDGAVLQERTYYSVGGGFVLNESAFPGDGDDTVIVEDSVIASLAGGAAQRSAPYPADARRRSRYTALPYPFRTGDDLLAYCRETGLPISEIMMRNELS
jgi:L-serine dehydratase